LGVERIHRTHVSRDYFAAAIAAHLQALARNSSLSSTAQRRVEATLAVP
jgi:hypothetical protein